MALIFVNGEGENVIGIHAALTFPFPALVAQRERIANASALLMQLESPPKV